MEPRALIVEKAAELLAQSPTGDVSTRAVCEAAGVTQPVLYRIFGDKDGLLAAVVDRVWDDYLGMKRAAVPSSDAVQDLLSGWDNHVAFACAHPHAYRLLFGTRLTTRPEAAVEAMTLLRAVLTRIAEQGRLRMPPEEAAQVVMAANTGVALGLLLHPELFGDTSVATAVRDATVRAVLTDPTDPTGAAGGSVDAPSVAATTLRAHLADGGSFTAGEAGLLDEWLERIEHRHHPA